MSENPNDDSLDRHVKNDLQEEINPENNQIAKTLAQKVSSWALRLGVSGLLGYCSGYFVKKTLKKAAYYIGGFFIMVQLLCMKNWLTVNWPQITKDFTEGMNPNDKESMIRRFFNILIFRIPQASLFAFGWYLGWKQSKM